MIIIFKVFFVIRVILNVAPAFLIVIIVIIQRIEVILSFISQHRILLRLTNVSLSGFHEGIICLTSKEG